MGTQQIGLIIIGIGATLNLICEIFRNDKLNKLIILILLIGFVTTLFEYLM